MRFRAFYHQFGWGRRAPCCDEDVGVGSRPLPCPLEGLLHRLSLAEPSAGIHAAQAVARISPAKRSLQVRPSETLSLPSLTAVVIEHLLCAMLMRSLAFA